MNKTKGNKENPPPQGKCQREGAGSVEQNEKKPAPVEDQKPAVVGAKSAPRGTPSGHSPLRSLAPPLPIEPASLGFDGGPSTPKP